MLKSCRGTPDELQGHGYRSHSRLCTWEHPFVTSLALDFPILLPSSFHSMRNTLYNQIIFAWGCRSCDNSRTSSILAEALGTPVPMVHDEFIQELRYSIPEEELSSIEDDHRCLAHSRSPIVASKCSCFSALMRAWSSCCSHPSAAPVTISIAL